MALLPRLGGGPPSGVRVAPSDRRRRGRVPAAASSRDRAGGSPPSTPMPFFQASAALVAVRPRGATPVDRVSLARPRGVGRSVEWHVSSVPELTAVGVQLQPWRAVGNSPAVMAVCWAGVAVPPARWSLLATRVPGRVGVCSRRLSRRRPSRPRPRQPWVSTQYPALCPVRRGTRLTLSAGCGPSMGVGRGLPQADACCRGIVAALPPSAVTRRAVL